MSFITAANVDMPDAQWSMQHAGVTDAGDRRWNIGVVPDGAAMLVWASTNRAVVGASTWRINLTATADGGPDWPMYVTFRHWQGASYVDVTTTNPVTVTAAGVSIFPNALTIPPAGTDHFDVILRGAPGASAISGKKLRLTTANYRRSADNIPLLDARLGRPQNTTLVEPPGGVPLVTSLPAGYRRGQLAFLAASLREAAMLDDLYRYGPGPWLYYDTTAGAAEGIGGLKHVSVDLVDVAAERTLNGIPARWMVTVPVREVP